MCSGRGRRVLVFSHLFSSDNALSIEQDKQGDVLPQLRSGRISVWGKLIWTLGRCLDRRFPGFGSVHPATTTSSAGRCPRGAKKGWRGQEREKHIEGRLVLYRSHPSFGHKFTPTWVFCCLMDRNHGSRVPKLRGRHSTMRAVQTL